MYKGIKYVCIIFLMSFLTFYGQSSYSLLRIKELYDYIYQKHNYGNNIQGLENYVRYTNPYYDYAYGEQWGYLLESYLIIYKTTKDKAYLIRFINETLRIMSWRRESYVFNHENLYMNGLLLWAMSHFCYLVLYEEPTLASIVIPGSVVHVPTSTFTVNILPTQPNYTFGFIADWLIHRLVETYDQLISTIWRDGKGFAKKVDKDSQIMEINMQGPFGGGLLYLGKIASNIPSYSGMLSYLDKGAILARLYKSKVKFYDRCYPSVACPYENDVLITNTDNNSYWWYHKGWVVDKRDAWQCAGELLDDCSKIFPQHRYDNYTEFIEDISHAISTLITPQVAYEIKLYTGGQYPFGLLEMIHFRNTFTKNIFHGDINNPEFYNSVDGRDDKVYCGGGCSPTPGMFRYVTPAYMPFYKFDNADPDAPPPNVYDILMNFFQNEIYPPNKNSNISGGIYGYGLAAMVNAQWDKECVNLKMYNRKMIYDQDFIVKNTLTIAPQESDIYYQSGDNSFAEPSINTPEFTIEPGVHVTMMAGERIQIKSGFRAKAGSQFTAKILPNLCTDGFRTAPSQHKDSTNADELIRMYLTQAKGATPGIVSLSYISPDSLIARRTFENNLSLSKTIVFPNPASDFVVIKSENNTYLNTVILKDVMGKIILENKMKSQIYLDIRDIQNGLYFIEIIGNDETKKYKLIIQH
ncbi:MAG: hypothetical protein KatS3mg027_2469 [Bacteroidia bacterium]|nr:MAG: hypothetical protein KatS3mg027_2469 [Bacteroidia bacterium]